MISNGKQYLMLDRNNLAFPERIIHTYFDITNGSTDKPNTKEN
jgi:hypothetical protein